MEIHNNNSEIIFSDISTLNVGLSLDCGQAFRWSEKNNGVWHGVAFGRAVDICQQDGTVTVSGDIRSGDEKLWSSYFDLERNYEKICADLSSDSYLNRAITEYKGIRILKQDEWEALCSFIISQNNNIPRIKGIII